MPPTPPVFFLEKAMHPQANEKGLLTIIKRPIEDSEPCLSMLNTVHCLSSQLLLLPAPAAWKLVHSHPCVVLLR